MIKARLLLIVLISIGVSSCGEYELLEHQRTCKRRADSTYRAHLKDVAKEVDSLCVVNKELYYQNALDSMIPQRIEEMKKLIAR